MSLLPLMLGAVLTATDGGVSLRVQIFTGDTPAPADTVVRLFRPVVAGEVLLCGTSEYRSAPKRSPDAQGWVDFGVVAPGHYTVEAAQDTWGRRRTGFDVSGAAQELRFPKGGELRVRVLTHEGAPAAAATVSLVPDRFEDGDSLVIIAGNDGAEYRGLRSAETGPDGVVELRGLPPRRYIALASLHDEVLSQGVAVDAGASIEVRLPEGLRIAGRVLTSDGGVLENPWLMIDAVKPPPRDEPVKAEWSRLLEPVPAQPHLNWYGAGFQTDGGARFDLETHFRTRVRVSARVDECEITRELEVQPPVSDVVLRGGPRAVVRAKLREPVEVSFICGEDLCYSQRLSAPGFSIELPVRCTGVYVNSGERETRRTFKLRSGQVVNLGELVLPAAKKR